MLNDDPPEVDSAIYTITLPIGMRRSGVNVRRIREIGMAANTNEPLSPTVTKVLDEYLAALHADDDLDNEMADRLDALLRKGKVPKPDDIDAALFPPAEGDNS